jgi:formate-dependent nitrite reductase membrane component NrfD
MSNTTIKRQFQTSWRGLTGLYLFLGGVGAGAYAVAAAGTLLGPAWEPIVNAGLYVSFPAVILGMLFLTAHLGKPFRSPKALARPGSSWISRGVWILGAFIVISLIHFLGQVGPYDYISNAPEGSALPAALSIIGLICALFVMLYTGALLSASKGYPFWRTGILPVLFMISATFTGLLATMIAAVAVDQSLVTKSHLQNMALVGGGLVLVELVTILFFLHAAYRTADTRESAQTMAKSGSFIFGDLILGLFVPLIIFMVMYFGMAESEVESLVTAGMVAAVLGLIGGLLLRLAVLSAGMSTALEVSGWKFRNPAVAPPVDWPMGKLPPS